MRSLAEVFGALLATVLFVSMAAHAQSSSAQQSRKASRISVLTEREVARNALRSTIQVFPKGRDGKTLSGARGFFVRDGFVVTNYHVVKAASRVYCRLIDGEQRI